MTGILVHEKSTLKVLEEDLLWIIFFSIGKGIKLRVQCYSESKYAQYSSIFDTPLCSFVSIGGMPTDAHTDRMCF